MSNYKNSDKEKDKDKDGKPLKAAASSAKGSTKSLTPGFAKGSFSLQADRNWQVKVMCVNGNTEKNFVTTLPNTVTYYGGGSISNPSETTLYLADGVTIDTNFIFPWDPTDADPLRLGGGNALGNILEGSQRQDASPKDPIYAPFLVSEWVNGAPYHMTVEIPAAFGITFFPGDRAFALVIVDPVTRKPVVKAVAKSEGSCLDLPVA